MKISQNGIALIMEFEGCKLAAYKCSAGIWTIGYGHTNNVHYADVITQGQAEQYLLEDLKDVENAINKLVLVHINQNQFDALASFIFNFGYGQFAGSTLRKLLNQSKYNEAAEQFDRWVYAKNPKTGQPEKLKGLIRRRNAEKELFLKTIEKEKTDMKIDVKRIVDTIQAVEAKYSELKGQDKKEKTIELINEFVDLPLLSEGIEAKLIGIAVDCIVEVFNQLVWKKVNPA